VLDLIDSQKELQTMLVWHRRSAISPIPSCFSLHPIVPVLAPSSPRTLTPFDPMEIWGCLTWTGLVISQPCLQPEFDDCPMIVQLFPLLHGFWGMGKPITYLATHAGDDAFSAAHRVEGGVIWVKFGKPSQSGMVFQCVYWILLTKPSKIGLFTGSSIKNGVFIWFNSRLSFYDRFSFFN